MALGQGDKKWKLHNASFLRGSFFLLIALLTYRGRCKKPFQYGYIPPAHNKQSPEEEGEYLYGIRWDSYIYFDPNVTERFTIYLTPFHHHHCNHACPIPEKGPLNATPPPANHEHSIPPSCFSPRAPRRVGAHAPYHGTPSTAQSIPASRTGPDPRNCCAKLRLGPKETNTKDKSQQAG